MSKEFSSRKAWERVWSEAPLKEVKENPDWRDFFTKFNSGPRVLECGCGEGLLCIYAAKHMRKEAYGFDYTQNAVKIAKLNAHKNKVFIKLLIASITNIPFRNNCFDLVYSLGTNEHLKGAERLKAFSEMVRVTKPKGWVVIDVTHALSPLYRLGMALRKALGYWPVGYEEPYLKREFELYRAKCGSLSEAKYVYRGFLGSIGYLLPRAKAPRFVGKLTGLFYQLRYKEPKALRMLGAGLTFYARKSAK